MKLNRPLCITMLSIVTMVGRVSFSESDVIDRHNRKTQGHPEATSDTSDLTIKAYTELLKEPKEEMVVLKFSATWCGPCQKLNPFFKKTAKNLAKYKNKIKFYEVDYEEQVAIVKAYQITSIPALIVLRKSKTAPYGYEKESIIFNVDPIKKALLDIEKKVSQAE
ncbi:MAG: thioredoxin [Bdellovibrionales bacterium]|nr:thioredoxin [Bdellovibrionales bacterium]